MGQRAFHAYFSGFERGPLIRDLRTCLARNFHSAHKEGCPANFCRAIRRECVRINLRMDRGGRWRMTISPPTMAPILDEAVLHFHPTMDNWQGAAITFDEVSWSGCFSGSML